LLLQARAHLLALLGKVDPIEPRGLAAARERGRDPAHDQQHARLDRVQLRAVDQRAGVLERRVERRERAVVVGDEAEALREPLVYVALRVVALGPAFVAEQRRRVLETA